MTGSLTLGDRLGGFVLEAKLGSGGFGEVFRGRPDVGAPRAIKVLRDRALADALRREAETLVGLRHRRIVELLHADLTSDPPFLVMELVEGGSIREVPLPPAEVQGVIRGVLDGLAHAHGRGIAHLDIKPSNVLMSRDGPRIVDFGLARAFEGVQGQLDHSQAESGRLGGTLAYMAPEQREGKPGNSRSDVYAVGVLLCVLLTGKFPQPGDTLDELLGRPAPRWAATVFDRCHTRYEKRFANAGEALGALEDSLRKGGSIMFCASCGHSNADEARFCAGCGAAVAASASGRVKTATEAPPAGRTARCPYCREEIAEGAIKCKHCNERLDGAKPLAARPAAPGMCAVHFDKGAAGACVSCGNLFCGDCLTPVKGKNHCKSCVTDLVEGKHKEIEKAQEQIEREKDRAAFSSKGGPNIVVTATGGGGGSSSSSATSSASASSSAAALAGGLGGVGGTGRGLLVSPFKAAVLGAVFPGFGHNYLGKSISSAILMLVGAVCTLMLIVCYAAAFRDPLKLQDGRLYEAPGWPMFLFGAVVFAWPWPLSSLLAYRAAVKINATGGLKQTHML